MVPFPVLVWQFPHSDFPTFHLRAISIFRRLPTYPKTAIPLHPAFNRLAIGRGKRPRFQTAMFPLLANFSNSAASYAREIRSSMFVLGSGKSDARTRKSMPWASFRAFYDWQQQLVVHTFRGRGKFPLFFQKMWEQNRETRSSHKLLAGALFHLRVLLP